VADSSDSPTSIAHVRAFVSAPHVLMKQDTNVPPPKMGYLSALTTFLYYLLYPIAVLLGWIFALLAIVAAPFLYLGHCIIIYTCWYPFHILAKFEVRSLPKLSPYDNRLMFCTDALHLPRCSNPCRCLDRDKSALHIRLHSHVVGFRWS